MVLVRSLDLDQQWKQIHGDLLALAHELGTWPFSRLSLSLSGAAQDAEVNSHATLHPVAETASRLLIRTGEAVTDAVSVHGSRFSRTCASPPGASLESFYTQRF